MGETTSLGGRVQSLTSTPPTVCVCVCACVVCVQCVCVCCVCVHAHVCSVSNQLLTTGDIIVQSVFEQCA